MCPLCDVPWLSCCLSLRRTSLLSCYARYLSRLLCCLLLCCTWGSAVSYALAHGRCFALRDTARGRFAPYRSTTPARSPALCAVFLGYCAAVCSAACGALWSPMLGPVGAPPPFVRLPVNAAPPFALPLPVAALLRALSCAVAALPPAPPLVGVCCRLCLGSCVLLRPLCDRSWALRCPMLYRTSSLPCSSPLYAVFRYCLAAFCSSARGAPLRPLPRPLGASPLVPLCSRSVLCSALSFDLTAPPPALLLPRLRCRLCLSSQVRPRPQCDGSWALCCLLLCRSWSLPRSGCRLPWGFRGAPTPRTPWPVGAPPFLVRLLLGASLPITLPLPVALLLRVSSFLVAVLPRAPAARKAPLSLMPGPVGAHPPFVRLLVGALLPVAPPLLVAPLLCEPSFDVAMVPPALPHLRLRYRLSLDVRVLLRLLCNGSWALRCLVLCRSRSLLGSVRRPSWLPRCLLLWCPWGSADASAWARGRSSALCAIARARFAALCPSALGRSSALCGVLQCYCAASGSTAP